MTKPAKATERGAAQCPGVVLFGLDETGKPRAARFRPDHGEPALMAAELMNLNVCHLTSPELTEIAQKLPAGRIHANGRGFVPNVRRDLYDRLVDAALAASADAAPSQTDANHPEPAAEAGETARGSNADPAAPAAAQGYPRDWDDISVGHLVIALADDGDGWWEAIVIGTDGDMLTMRWRDYPTYEKFTHNRSNVALLKPGTP
jgi:hypothetical protein